ncbi:hypothetical protein PIROE2DRAFT_9187 [Piromyces sp. E2]|nr:hypothetical protein PIROE2DRAFT_9187 [Piromyces sp. E2]|eukprot:OUM64147.1 hypothetical protein PIROE2DRAFT_9187 [Piromyces sp. E2]
MNNLRNTNTNNTILDRFSKETETCYGKNNQKFIDDFFGQFQDSFCFTFVLQFLLVLLMYANVGKGKYWKILFYAALAGFLGSLIENGTVAYICKSKESYNYILPFLINEIFWIPNEYAIPMLNLIKMKAFSDGKLGIVTKYLIFALAFPFIGFRLFIGYYRMTDGYLQNIRIHAFHGYAFAVMAVADIICTVVLLYLIKENNKKIAISGSNINEFVKHSSYTILIAVDIVSAVLSICNIIANVGPLKDDFPDKLFTPFHCLKCSSILILAIDAFIFKYGANVSSNNESTGQRIYGNDSTGTYANTNTNYNNNNNNTSGSVNSTYRSKLTTNFSSEINNPNKKNSMISIAPFNYSTSSKTIVKNYVSNKLSTNNDSYDRTIYSSQSFGFLN